jgi:hypothetical protein
MSASVDGYIVGPDGSFDWTPPDNEVFRFWIDETREVGVHLMGRRLYQTKLSWETADQDRLFDDAELEWAALWNPLPKVACPRRSPRSRELPAWRPAASLRRSSACGRSRAKVTSRSAARRSPPTRRSWVRLTSIGSSSIGCWWRWHTVLSSARPSSGPRTRRNPHLQLEGRLPALPRGEIGDDRAR